MNKVKKNIAEIIIDDIFGGTTKAAKMIGFQPARVQNWKSRGYIPARVQQKVLDTAKQNGIDLKPADFFSTPVRHS